MKKKRILALFLAAVSCLSLAVSASAAGTTTRKATDFKDYDRTAWYAEAVSAAVDNGLLYGKSSTIIDPNGDMTRAEMAAIINRSFGCYKTADISQYKDVAKSKWYYKDVALAVQMGTYNGRSSSSMAPDAPISRQEAMTVVARALELDYDAYAKTDLSAFSDRSEISNWAMPYVRAMVGADQDAALDVLVVAAFCGDVCADDVMENLRKFCAGDIIQRGKEFATAVNVVCTDHRADVW